MFPIKIATASVNQTPIDWAGNTQHIIDAITAARAESVQVLCLPELAITAYGCEDAFHGTDVSDRALICLREIITHCQDIMVCVGLPLRWHGALYNVVAIIVDAELVGFYAKQHLAGDGVHYEPRWFQAWPAQQQVAFPWDDRQVPLGDVYLDQAGLRFGFEICEDAWVPQRPAAEKAAMALDIVLNPSASHFAFDKFQVRQDIVREGSRMLQCCYVYANLLGNESGRMIFDGGGVIAQGGEIIAVAERFALADWTMQTAVVDIDKTRRAQARMTSFKTNPIDGPGLIQHHWQMQTAMAQIEAVPAQAAWEHGAYLKEETFTRAVAMGLIDYIRKAHSKGVVISLSGGADSAAVAVLMKVAWDWGRQYFGAAAWKQRIGLKPDEEFDRWCTCVYQRTKNSGDVTEQAARLLAECIQARFHVIDVDDIVQAYQNRVEDMLGRALNWQDDDIALQNIQARARAPSVWMLANTMNALLLATSNRSEAAVGYATMDGDTCGGLSPLAGIDKAFLRHWLFWMQTVGAEMTPAIAALEAITNQAPTAELRPAAATQTDEDDLMPYPVLDVIEALAIRDKLAPLAVYQQLQLRYPAYEDEQLAFWTKRFFQLWSRNQWKRERYAPSFHLDDKNLDPKTWCRFPILSGGFETELAELEHYLATRAEEELCNA